MRRYIILVLLAGPLFAQYSDSLEYHHTSKVIQIPQNYYSLGMNAYNEDFLLGISYKSSIAAAKGLSFKTQLWIRPFLKNVLYQKDSQTYYIFRENRTQLIIGLEKMQPLSSALSLFASVSVSPTAFFYMGSKRDFSDLILPVVETGFSLKVTGKSGNSHIMNIDIGYRFSNEESNRHGLFLMLRFPV